MKHDQGLTAGALWLLVLAVACGAGHRAQPLGDGSWRARCADHLEPCIRQAQRICNDEGYRVLAGRKETKLYGGDTGYQTGVDMHTLEFRCGSVQPEALVEEPSANPERKPPLTSDKPTARQVCTPGATQRCVGPAACEGGQTCKADGTGFLPCDCGEARSEPPVQQPANDASKPDKPPDSGELDQSAGDS